VGLKIETPVPVFCHGEASVQNPVHKLVRMDAPHFVGAPPLGTLDLTEPFQMLLIVDFQKRFRIVWPIGLSCSESFSTSICYVLRHAKIESGGDVKITRDFLFL
jgi:hypothetical protein